MIFRIAQWFQDL